MQSRTGSLMDLFSCRSCKKRRHHNRQSKFSPPTVAPQNRQSALDENAPRVPAAPSFASADDDCIECGDRSQINCTDDSSDVDARAEVTSPAETGFRQSIPGISMSNFELSRELIRARQSILKNGDGLSGSENKRYSSASGTDKRARFKEAVDVIIHDHHGNAIVKDSVKLKDADRMESPSGERSKKHVFAEERPLSRSNTRLRSVFSLRSMRIEREKNGRRFLRLVVALGEAFTERSVHVCTTKGGSRILVGAYKSEPLGDGTNYLRQYVDRFQLPHPVDAFSIHGELDRFGELVITAPLFDYDNDSSVDSFS